jgi:hypothetical protein
MTAKQPPPSVAGTIERRERGLEIADALLESGREFSPLAGLAHARVKRRLVESTRRRSFRSLRWLRPVVIVSLCLVCGAAFGIALDRVVLKRGAGAPTTPSDVESRLGPSRAYSRGTSSKAPQTAAAQTGADSKAVSAEIPLSHEVPRPTTNVEVADTPETPSPAHYSNHVRKLALRAEPVDTLLGQSPSGGRDLATVAPPGVAADWPASAASTGQSPASGQTPASNTATLVLPGATAISPGSSLVKTHAGDGLSEERLLAAAIRALRAKTDPPSALAALDEYRNHYPHGRLFVEAEVLRVDALAALKNTFEALRVLDGLDFAQMPGGLARQLQRAELRAAAGRYREAEADFANVLVRARSQDLDVRERALWGRAQSRVGLGDADGARTDANEYVRRFPSGRFAAAAARMASPVTP